jgi:hypothetical protein
MHVYTDTDNRQCNLPIYAGCRFIAYLTAVNDVCTSFSGQQLADMAQCDEVPFCRALLPDADGHPLLETQYEKVVETVLVSCGGWQTAQV